jgi:hypothetical protein
MKIENIDSKVVVRRELFEKTFQRLTYLGSVVPKLSFYLVNEKTMDEICPPRKGYDDEGECIDSLKNLSEKVNSENIDKVLGEIWEGLQRCKTKVYSALACYCNNSIYICPERIKSDKLFPFVLIHELVHAYLDSKNKVYGEVIEESIANAVALLHYRNSEVFELINGQSAEYKGCYFWLRSFPRNYLISHILHNLRKGDLLEFLKLWYYVYEGYKIVIGFDDSWLRYFPWLWFYHFNFDEIIYASYEHYRKTGNKQPFYKALEIVILKYVAESKK